MQKKILVNVDAYETQIAVLEDSVLVEFYFERGDYHQLVGNIYKGEVISLVEGIDAAFVDIGLERNAFLFISDIIPPLNRDGFLLTDIGETEFFHLGEGNPEQESILPPPSICDLLKTGQEILVQITKEPIGNKGSRVSTSLSLPGRYLVLLPTTDQIGISRRIREQTERDRLRRIAKSIVPSHMGVIVRTAGEGHPGEDFEADMQFLMTQWNRIRRISDSTQAPALIHEESIIAHRLVRDIYTPEVSTVVVNDRHMQECITEYMRATIPNTVPQVKLDENSEPLFKSFGVDTEISSLRSSQIWLHCGGYIVIDEAEALTAIDVNTGKFVGERHFEDTILAANLEAAVEIARQIRLRDLGGIIVIDFIDMQIPENRDRVLNRLDECLQRDRSRSQILGITKLGLVEMTRKRVRESLNKILSQECPYCKGRGSILSAESMTIRAMRKLERLCRESYMKEIRLYVHPDVASRIVEERHEDIQRLEKDCRKTIRVIAAPNLHVEDIKDAFSYDKASMLELT